MTNSRNKTINHLIVTLSNRVCQDSNHTETDRGLEMPTYRQSWSEADRPWSTREANHISAFIIRNHFLYPQDLTRSNIRNKVAFIRICFTRDMQECLETKIIQVAGQLRAAGLQSISFIHLMQIGYPKRPTSTTGWIFFHSREKSDTLKADTYLGGIVHGDTGC